MEKCEKSPSKLSMWRQILLTLVVNILTISYGVIIGWQSSFAPQLQSSSPPVGNESMTDEGVSWLNGILCVGGTFTTVVFSLLPDKYSRKRIGYLIILPWCISWLLIIVATEHIYIYISKFLSGIFGGILFFYVPIYVSEISDDSIRGLLGSILAFAINFGILLAYILGGMLSFRTYAIVNLVLPALYLITFVFMPESPVYLIRQDRIREATRSLMWLKAGDRLVAERTLSYLQAEMKQNDMVAKSVKLSDLFKDRATIKGLIIVVGLFLGQQFCGIFAMLSYTETIFELSGSSLLPNTAAIIIGAIQFFGSCLASLFMERAGRRLLILVSCAGMCLCQSVMGMFCYFQEFGYDVSVYDWVPVVALSTFMIAYSCGMSSVPIIVMAEIFNRNVTSVATKIGLFFLWVSAFIVTKIFPTLIALLGMYGCFFLLAFSCAFSFIFCFMLLPETKGRMREDIVNELNECTKNKKNTKRIIGTHSTDAARV
ncbi:facilitated trehalose transporter Tret1 [Harpegnathos saltator]|uniref:facilitated trehalose transporter Tret1 n=1 Tax=Harpegnathos saltator TaxID=610380 RepID=UPI00058FE88D|nr:facilitated trehalose transporter Tret1 [Harpegnathos saltator]